MLDIICVCIHRELDEPTMSCPFMDYELELSMFTGRNALDEVKR